MSLFHRHKWRIINANFTEPVPFRIDRVQSPTEEILSMIRRWQEGITHVYLGCEGCGDLKEIDFFGKFTQTDNDAELEELRRLVKL